MKVKDKKVLRMRQNTQPGKEGNLAGHGAMEQKT